VTEQRASAMAPSERLVTPREGVYRAAQSEVATRLILSKSDGDDGS
jgi:hypothetical protein